MLYNLQALRAVAAVLVVLLHLADLSRFAGLSPNALTFGGAGVDLFFVISGFVMVRTTMARSVTPAGFILNRIIRVVPLYWLITTSLFLVMILVPSAFASMDADLIAFLKSLFFIPYVRFDGGVQPLLFVGWTLNLEMMFYAIFACALLVEGTGKRIALITAVLAMIVVIATITPSPSRVLEFIGTSLLLEFALGMWLAVIHQRGLRMRPMAAWTWIWSGVAVILGHAFVMDGQYRFLLYGLPSLAIVAGALSLERDGIVAKSKSVQLLGASSYALYLSHPFPAIAGTRLADQVLNLAGVPGVILLGLVTLLSAALIAILVHLGLEQPIARLFRRKPSNEQVPAPSNAQVDKQISQHS